MSKIIKKWQLNLFGLVAVLFLLNACVKDSLHEDARDNWVGSWTCNEIQGDFAPQSYQVEIIERIDFTHVSIKGLYNQGYGFTVDAEVEGSLIEIPTQEFDVFTISGNGSLDNDVITLYFAIDDGSGNDNVTAKLYR